MGKKYKKKLAISVSICLIETKTLTEMLLDLLMQVPELIEHNFENRVDKREPTHPRKKDSYKTEHILTHSN